MMHANIRSLDAREIDDVSGGFICGGLCVLGGIAAGVALYAGAVSIGQAWGNATRKR